MKTNNKWMLLASALLLSTSLIPTAHGSYMDSGHFYSTLFGGSGDDRIRDIVLDSQGNILITGGTFSDDLPVLDAVQPEYGGGTLPPGEYFHSMGDAFVAKFTPDYELLWSTYIGGSGFELALHVKVDMHDNVLVFGRTTSDDFPWTFDSTPTGREEGDPFIALYTPDGELIGSRLYVPDEINRIEHVDMDSNGNIVIGGVTSSTNMYCTEDAISSELSGESDGFVRVVSPDFEEVLYSTYIGGSGDEYIGEIAVGQDDSIYVSGSTGSDDLPVTENCLRPEKNDEENDNFITKIGPSRNLILMTYFGGSDVDHIFGLCEGMRGSIAIVGRTWSTDFPLTDNAFQTEYAGDVDGYLTVLDETGSEVLYSSYYGGAEWDSLLQVNLITQGKIVTTGFVHSGEVDSVNAFQPEYTGASEIVVTIWGEVVELNSYLGGYGSEHPFAQIFEDNTMYLVGSTDSSGFVVSDDAYQTTIKGGMDGFIWRMDIDSYRESGVPSETSSSDYRQEISYVVVLGVIAIWFVYMRKTFGES
jgi:hypothetical protein